jgi:maltooligosyltrehalose trehalohydrolase
MKLGANFIGSNKCEFVVWAPFAKKISLKLSSHSWQLISMDKDADGYWSVTADDAVPGTSYFYNINGEKDMPDPASFSQPDGVHTASQLINHSTFTWHDQGWKGILLSEMIIYEMHMGTFTSEGTFDAAVTRIDVLRDIGINAVEIMPVAQFPGERNWGYDGVYPFAVQNSYGGPEGLKKFVNECHKMGVAVILDVVYNHLGPEGNYLWDYGPYFTDRYKTPWGCAINFDGPYSNGVRNYFIENAMYWFRDFHIDALRLDAIHGINDMSARPFLLELSERAEQFSQQNGRKYYLMAESDLNDSRVAKSISGGGLGIDSLWCDDFHHSIHSLLTGESSVYYADFGHTEHMIKSLKEGYVYSGQYSLFRKRNHGNSSAELPAERLIVFSQNHDQTGNRAKGNRMAELVSFEALKLAAGIVILSPYIPLLFMGEEYGETTPFLYFISHSNPDLIEAIRQGRKNELEVFNSRDELPDPQSEDTFMKSKIQWSRREKGDNKVLLGYYKELIRLRKTVTPLLNLDKNNLSVSNDMGEKIIVMRRWKDNGSALVIINFNREDIEINKLLLEMNFKKILDSSDKKWNGPGSVLPKTLKHNKKIRMRGESLALYLNEPCCDEVGSQL